MSKNTTTETSGVSIGFASLLGLLFIALKLTGTIHWSWLWVLSPFWIPWVVIIVILIVAGIGVAIYRK